MGTDFKCVIVGDGAVGKTSLLNSYISNTFDTNCLPTVIDNYSVAVNVDGIQVTLGLWDTSGSESYDNIRHRTYQWADVFVIAFSLVHKGNYQNLWSKWLPELKHYAPTVPIILVGTQQDLREDVDFFKENPVSTAENVKAVFEEAVKVDRFIKCVTVGDGAVGKTYLLKSYTSNTVPTAVFDNFSVVNVKESQVNLGQWDTAGQIDYRGADVFVLAFSLVSQNSYESVYKKWLPELKHHAPMVPIILVGTKQDTDSSYHLREDEDFVEENPQFTPISTAQIDELKRMVGFGVSAYIECSAKLEQNMDAVLEEAVKAVLQRRKKKRKGVRALLRTAFRI